MAISRALGYDHGLAWGLLNAAYRDYYVARYDLAMNKALECIELFEALDVPLGKPATSVWASA